MDPTNSQQQQQQQSQAPPVSNQILTKQKLYEIMETCVPGERLEPIVESFLIKMSEDFVAKVTMAGADLARHRRSSILEARDVQLHLEKHWDLSHVAPNASGMVSSEDQRVLSRLGPTEVHQQRRAAVRRDQQQQQQ